MTEQQTFRAALVGDIHYAGTENEALTEAIIAKMAARADVLFFQGDLINDGRASQAEVIGRFVREAGKPAYGVLGNHEHRGEVEEVVHAYEKGGLRILRTEAETIDQNGVKLSVIGFKGGYDGTLAHQILPEREKQVLKGRKGLDPQLEIFEHLVDGLDGIPSIVLTHYATTIATITGEDEERFDLHGSLRVGQVADRRAESIVGIFHGHTHRGQLRGVTTRNIPVYNVSVPVLGKELGMSREEVEVDPPILLATFGPEGMIDVFVSR